MSPNVQEKGQVAKRFRCMCFPLVCAGCVTVLYVLYGLTPYKDFMIYGKKSRNTTDIALGHVYRNLTQFPEFPRKDFAKEDWPGSIWPKVLSTRSWQESASRASANQTTLKIFYWTSQYSLRDWEIGAGREPFVKNNCSIHQCETTRDPTAFNSSHYVLFHQVGLRKGLPKVKLPGQKWVFLMVESPVYSSKVKWPDYNRLFEVVMDKTLFSDIPVLKDYFRRKPTTVRGGLVNYAQGKNQDKDSLVAWFVSHCDTQSKREKYVCELQKHIHVDVYGRCGPKTCPRTRNGRSPEKDPCMNMLHKQYKFYLSFENSLCEDYVTEKVWSLFKEGINVVPVVLGGANYSRLFPPHSYIDVLDFNSPEHLARYLYLLNENDTLFKEYFSWRDRYSVQPSNVMTCGLCSYLHSHANTPQEGHRDLDQVKSPKKHCVSSKEYYGSRLKI